MACKIIVNRHGHLTFRIYFAGQEFWEGTSHPDTPEDRLLVEAQAKLISREIKKGIFDYLRWFPNGNKAHLFRPTPAAEKPLKTIREYYKLWIERKKVPFIRPGLARDYRDHFGRYILPKFENTALSELTPADLEAFRSYLVEERGLSVKSARNIIDASFRAMMRDARQVDYLIEKDPFEALRWPRIRNAKPDPFTEDERDQVIAYFKEKIPFYFPFASSLFLTGMRPSEALALRWGDVDLRRGQLSINKSRYLGSDASPKTPGSDREIAIHGYVVAALESIKPLHVTEEQHVFLNREGNLLNFPTWRKGIWYRALRAKKMRPRRPYTMRHTFISAGLSAGANPKWLADYCGTSLAMIEKHYGKYIRNDSAEQLDRIFGAQNRDLDRDPAADEQVQVSESAGNAEKRVGGPTWIRTRDLPVMSRWL
jgi:integrase